MPTSPDWAAVDAAFAQALDRDGADREAYLEALDPAICDALGPLLRDARRDFPLLDRPREVLEALTGDDAEVAEGVRVGAYRIQALVGEGGMGRVYRAHRADGAFDQTVALKVVRQSLALAGSDVAARLRRERDLLAALDHPGIARLIDGGETEDGVPYLVTEFVDGAPITDWADARDLDVRARVRLMAEVARAVDHAHRRFVVHRDLKPSNVLVTERDGAARPVVLDFGIAKLLEAADGATGAFPLTRTGMRLLTPAYAAPELFDPTLGTTVAADIYGLGALLYELLTGLRPHGDAPTAPTTEPVRPSRAVTDILQTEGTRRSTASARALRGDLDVICLKALHPDPSRRYGSAAALADDLDRHLSGRPVDARPDSLGYIVGRFARRNRTLAATAALAVLALVGGLSVSLVSLGNEREARAESEVQAERATEAADLLADILRTANPDYDEGRAVTVAEAVDLGVRRVRDVQSAPLRAYLLRVLGETYIQLGEPVMADSLLWEALTIHGEGSASDEATRVRRSLLSTQDALTRPGQVIALARRLLQDDPDGVESYLAWMSRAYTDLEQHGRAQEAAQRAYDLSRGGAVESRIHAARRLGEALASGGRVEEAIPMLNEAVRLSVATYGLDDGETARALTSLGRALGEAGDVAGAEEALRASMAFHAERYGEDRVAYQMAYLGVAKLRVGRPREAVVLLDSALTMALQIVSPTHADVGEWLTQKAEAHNEAGDYAAAARAARQAVTAGEAQEPRVREAAVRRARAQLDRARAR